LTEQEIFESLKSGSIENLGIVYERYRDDCMNWLIRKYSCTEDNAREVYQVSVITLYENIIRNKFTEVRSSFKTYLFSIAKNKCMELHRANKRNTDLGPLMHLTWDDVNENIPEEQVMILRYCLDKLGDPCNTLLKKFYYEQCNMVEICEEMGYKNPESARNQKYKCLQRLRKLYRDTIVARTG